MKRPRVNGGGAVLATMLAAATLSCSAPPQAPAPDYLIVPQVQIDRRWAGPGSPVELTYRFDVSPENGAIARDYVVAVDFVDAVGEVVFSDHHMPPDPTSSWASGSRIQYDRTVFVPLDAPPGPTTVELALRSPSGQRVLLPGVAGGPASIVSEVGRLSVDPQPSGIPISFGEGWHSVEGTRGPPPSQWRWTADDASSTFPNPGTDVVVVLHAEAYAPEGESAEVSMRVGPELLEVALLRVEQPAPFLQRVLVPAALFGGQDPVSLVISTDQVLVPSESGISNDPRRLGLRVFNLHIEPR